MEGHRDGCNPINEVLEEEYNTVGVAAEMCAVMAVVLRSPDVDSDFKQRVVNFAVARRRALEELGDYEAASLYESLIEAEGFEWDD